MVTIPLTSTAFDSGESIPAKYTGEGADISPPLAWQDLPEGTEELALICDDPDAPTEEPWVHWVLYGMPADTPCLPEAVPPDPQLEHPAGAMHGKNSWPSGQLLGYRGPMPPIGHGTHHYFFRLYALDAKISVAAGLTKNQLLDAMRGHVLGQGELMGTYERQ